MHAGGVLIQLVEYAPGTTAAVAREAGRARASAGNKLAEQNPVVLRLPADDGAACRQGARRAIGTANACATEKPSRSGPWSVQRFVAEVPLEPAAAEALPAASNCGMRSGRCHTGVDLAVEVGALGVQ